MPDSESPTTDRWHIAFASAVAVLHEYAEMMEQGEVPLLSGPDALRRAAQVIHDQVSKDESNGE